MVHRLAKPKLQTNVTMWSTGCRLLLGFCIVFVKQRLHFNLALLVQCQNIIQSLPEVGRTVGMPSALLVLEIDSPDVILRLCRLAIGHKGPCRNMMHILLLSANDRLTVSKWMTIIEGHCALLLPSGQWCKSIQGLIRYLHDGKVS